MKDPLKESFENLVNQVAHDIRNHMFTMGLQAELGQRRCGGLPEVKAHFDAILAQVDALRKYLDELLLFSRPVRLAPLSVDPAAFVQDQVRNYQSRHGSGAEIVVRAEPGELSRRARWDPVSLGHAVHALLDNAVRSANPAPRTVISVRSEAEIVTIEVKDGGPGIPPDILPKLATPMAVRRAGSLGLGLAVARKMAEAHGGRLEIESGGEGTTARLVVPWEVPAPAAQPQ
jgi:signal transduction histidine kinase